MKYIIDEEDFKICKISLGVKGKPLNIPTEEEIEKMASKYALKTNPRLRENSIGHTQLTLQLKYFADEILKHLNLDSDE